MYYSATATGYISTPSFAIPNTGILTVETWMKSKSDATYKPIMGEGAVSGTVGFIYIYRMINSDTLYYNYADSTSRQEAPANNFFTGLDNQ